MGLCCSRGSHKPNSGIKAKYHVIDGRRYVRIDNSEYIGPADDREEERLNNNHYMMKYWIKGNFKSPVHELLKSGITVLEVGCGPGTWILDMAREYPNSTFVGVDISHLFPDDNLPPNVEFLQRNLLDGLPYSDGYFGFVHQRFLGIAFTQTQWQQRVIQELARVTKPKGWIELVEIDEWITEGETIQQISRGMYAYLKSRSVNPQIVPEIPGIAESTGEFAQVRVDRMNIPLGEKGGYWGGVALNVLVEGIRAGKPLFSTAMDITHEEYDLLVEKMIREANEQGLLWAQWRICAQKH